MHVQALRSQDEFLNPFEEISFWTETLRAGGTVLSSIPFRKGCNSVMLKNVMVEPELPIDFCAILSYNRDVMTS